MVFSILISHWTLWKIWRAEENLRTYLRSIWLLRFERYLWWNIIEPTGKQPGGQIQEGSGNLEAQNRRAMVREPTSSIRPICNDLFRTEKAQHFDIRCWCNFLANFTCLILTFLKLVSSLPFWQTLPGSFWFSLTASSAVLVGNRERGELDQDKKFSETETEINNNGSRPQRRQPHTTMKQL